LSKVSQLDPYLYVFVTRRETQLKNFWERYRLFWNIVKSFSIRSIFLCFYHM